ncbi:fdrA domain protein [Alkaliphilus transvaalensis]|uniref:fdrA domain protein n=1 Tax=Alkaliphilus transvaalensis TaxID=114628 RepID=UPI000A038C2F|nr:fdrA domain protein [Alkaliphilus transvaalensis]
MNKINQLFQQDLKVINIGLESFYRDLKEQKTKVIHVNWRPTAGGNKRLIALLAQLKK